MAVEVCVLKCRHRRQHSMFNKECVFELDFQLTRFSAVKTDQMCKKTLILGWNRIKPLAASTEGNTIFTPLGCSSYPPQPSASVDTKCTLGV